LKQEFYNTLGGAVRAAITFLTIPLLIRIIGLQEFGLWALVSAVVGVIALLEGGLSVSTTVFMARDLARGDRVGVAQTLTANLAAILALATLAGAILWWGGGLVANLFPDLTLGQKATATSAMRISAFVVWVRLLQQVMVGIEQACQRYDLMNGITTAQATLGNLGMLAVGSFGGRIVELMQWQLVVGLLILVAHAIAAGSLLRHLGLRPAWNREKSGYVWRYSLLAWVSTLGSALFSQCDRIIVGRILGTGGVGIYAAITSVTRQINALSTLPVQPLVPFLAKEGASDQTGSRRVRDRVRQALELNALVALGAGMVLFLLAPWILRILLPVSEVPPPVLEFQIAVFIFSLYSLNAVGYYVFYGVQALKECVLIQLASGILALALIGIGAWHWGLVGAVAGTAGYQLVWLLTFRAMRRIQIPAREWLGWLMAYLAWFLLVLPSETVLPYNLALRSGVVIALALLLVSWFLFNQRAILALAVKRLLSR